MSHSRDWSSTILVDDAQRAEAHLVRIVIMALDEGKRRAQLGEWLKRDLETWFSGRVLPVNRQVAERWASLVAQSVRTGRPLPTIDSLIAATALAHGLTVATRNTRDFERAGVEVVDPFA